MPEQAEHSLSISNQTFRLEIRRAVASGIVETAQTTFLLLILVRWFAADPQSKALVAGANSIGLLLCPFVVFAVSRLQVRTAAASSCIMLLGAWAFIAASLVHSLQWFVFWVLVAVASMNAIVPLITQIYQENYPALKRGRLFAKTNALRIIAAGSFAGLGGTLLTGQIYLYPLLLGFFAGALCYSAWILSHYRSTPLLGAAHLSLFSGFRALKTDRLFRMTLIAWMVLGFGNLMMLPLRVEYLANPKYGLNLSEAQIALYVGVLPSISRLIFCYIWGWLFDRMNFFALRISINLGFLSAIIAFYLSESALGLALGSIIFGASNAGGEIAWNLWTTKFAPEDKVAAYMGVHTFFTGVRGILAPMLAFSLTASWHITSVALLGAGLILTSCLLLLREVRPH